MRLKGGGGGGEGEWVGWGRGGDTSWKKSPDFRFPLVGISYNSFFQMQTLVKKVFPKLKFISRSNGESPGLKGKAVEPIRKVLSDS